MSFKLAELFVQIGANLKPLHDDMAKAKASLAALAATPITLPMVALTAAAGAAAVAVYKCTDAASDLNEALNKSGIAFGDSVRQVNDYVDEMAKKFGAPKTELLNATSNFGMMARGAGQAEDAAAAFAKEMAQCAIDAKSVNNVGLPASLEKIRAGLSGESEPLRAFSVFLTENAVKAEAARLGLAAYNAELTEGQKIAARASLIKQGLAYAKGDREKTAGGFANQSEELRGRLTNLAASVGQIFLPAAEKMAAGINGALKSLEAAFAGVEAHAASFSSFFDAVVENARAAW